MAMAVTEEVVMKLQLQLVGNSYRGKLISSLN